MLRYISIFALFLAAHAAVQYDYYDINEVFNEFTVDCGTVDDPKMVILYGGNAFTMYAVDAPTACVAQEVAPAVFRIDVNYEDTECPIQSTGEPPVKMLELVVQKGYVRQFSDPFKQITCNYGLGGQQQSSYTDTDEGNLVPRQPVWDTANAATTVDTVSLGVYGTDNLEVNTAYLGSYIQLRAFITDNEGYIALENGPGCGTASIETAEECGLAAASLGYSADVTTMDVAHAPLGCHLGHPGDGWANTYFNLQEGETGRENYMSICKAVDGEHSIKIFNCRAYTNALSYYMVLAGCGEGDVIANNRGFRTRAEDGYPAYFRVSRSSYFKSFLLPGEDTISFECDYILCTDLEQCDGLSCPDSVSSGITARRKRSILDKEMILTNRPTITSKPITLMKTPASLLATADELVRDVETERIYRGAQGEILVEEVTEELDIVKIGLIAGVSTLGVLFLIFSLLLCVRSYFLQTTVPHHYYSHTQLTSPCMDDSTCTSMSSSKPVAL